MKKNTTALNVDRTNNFAKQSAVFPLKNTLFNRDLDICRCMDTNFAPRFSSFDKV